jgi:hypothetical protein
MRGRRVLMVVTVVAVAGAVTAVELWGPPFLEVLSWALAPVALVVAVGALDPAGTRALIAGVLAAVRRQRRTALCVLLLPVLLIGAGGSAGRPSLNTVTGVVLVFEGRVPNVVFTRAADGVGYCSRTDRTWVTRWRGPSIARDWPRFDDFTAFTSTYGGLEVFGRRGDRLVFGYRDPDLRWHAVQQIGGGIAGKPAALEDGTPDVGRRFLVFAADGAGGVKVFERTDYAGGWPPQWSARSTLRTPLADIDGLAAAKDRHGRLVLVLRSRGRLFQMHRDPAPTGKDVSAGWSSPRPLRLPGRALPAVTGDPAYAAVDDISVARALHVAVPTASGVVLLSTRDVTRDWQIETVALGFTPEAVARLDSAAADDSRSTVIVLVRDQALEYVWRDGRSTWSEPVRLTC